jgi:hypothetical protein
MGHSASPTCLSLRNSRRGHAVSSLHVGLVLWASAAVSCGADATGDASSATQTSIAPTASIGAAAGTLATAPALTPGTGTQPAATMQPAASATGAMGATGTAAGPSQAAGAAAPAAGAAGAGAPNAAAGTGAHAEGHASHDSDCLWKVSVDPRDEMLTDEPLVWEGAGQKDLLVPQIVLDWMGENEFESSHDGWHLVRKWDQSCLQSNASASSCRAAQRLQMQGLERAPIQQGGKGDGLAFMAMHRHMIHMLDATFPKHTSLFDGFTKVPRTSEDKQNPAGHRLSWGADNIKGFDILENIEDNLSMFPTEDDLGNYIENTYRWTEQTPMQPTNQPGSGLHGALHAQWAINGSPGNLIEQAVDVRNFLFWKLHGWIDDVWERYRVAKGLTENDPAYVKIMSEQCNEMWYLKKSNRGMPMQPTGSTTGGTGAQGGAETGYFATQVRPFLDTSCGGCHSAIGPSAGLTLGGTGITSAEVMESLVGKKSTNGEFNLIEPGAPQRSWVYLKASGESSTVMCTSACGRQKMPPSGDGLTAAQLQALSKWIMDGAGTQ